MTDTAAPERTAFRPSDWHITWVANAWGWTDLTDEELRCLWVLERYLGESGHKFYHLPQYSGLDPQRMKFNRAAFTTTTLHDVCSFDDQGLAALVVAAFAAAVRVSIGTQSAYVNWAEEEPRLFWTAEEAEAEARRQFIDYYGGPFWIKVGDDDEYRAESYAALSTSLIEAREFARKGTTITYGDVNPGDTPLDIHEKEVLVIHFHARDPADAATPSDQRLYECHPGTEYLTNMIDHYRPTIPGAPT